MFVHDKTTQNIAANLFRGLPLDIGGGGARVLCWQ